MTTTKDLLVASPSPLWTSKAEPEVGHALEDLECDRMSATSHGVYLICFDRPFAHARHYLGWASNISERVEHHRTSGRRCARLMRAVNDAGIGWRVVRTWPGLEKGDERRMKQSGHARRCPCCKRGTYGPAH